MVPPGPRIEAHHLGIPPLFGHGDLDGATEQTVQLRLAIFSFHLVIARQRGGLVV